MIGVNSFYFHNIPAMHEFFKSTVIEGDSWERTGLVRIEAFLSAVARKFDFDSDKSSFGSFEELRKSQLCRLEISVRKTERLKYLKLL